MAKSKAESNSSIALKKKNKKNSKHQMSGPAAAAMKASKTAKPNPFETIWSRRKFDILGKSRKGEERRVGLAKSAAIEKRKKTLQKEYEQCTKSSSFIDNRIGEKDDTLQEFDKAVLRLQRERQLKLKRNNKYNLSDGEEDDPITDQVDDFEEEIPLDDDEDLLNGSKGGSDLSERLNLHAMHDPSETSLADGRESVYKTKKQVMSEIILKSKFYKAQKAKDKEEDDHLNEKLDQDFSSIAQTPLMQPSKMNALKALQNKTNTRHSSKGSSNSADREPVEKEKPDDYSKLVKQMALEMRARPSDRTKTPEEIAQEERERLELLEEERRKRMVADDDSSGEDSSSGEEDHESELKRSRAISGDDLGDSFSADEKTAHRKGWVDDIYEKEDMDNDIEDDASSEGAESDDNDQEGSDSENNDNDNGNELDIMSSMKDWEQSDDDDLGRDDEGEDADEREVLRKSMNFEKLDTLDNNKTNSSEKLVRLKQEALPYVIECPNNLTELCSLLDGRSDAEVVEAVNRIRAYNSIRLAAENRRKMQVFYGVLLQYFAVLATRSPLNISRLNSLVKPLVEMSGETPYFAAICARHRLIHTRTRFCEEIKIPEKSSWPSLKTLLLLRLWSLIFPCSDFRHVVMTPAILLMCEYLMRCPIVSGRDIAIGSFLCSMVLSVVKQSRKFCPEATIFLKTLLLSTMELEPGLQQNSQCFHLMELKTSKSWLHISDRDCEVQPIDFLVVMDSQADSPYFVSDKFKASILISVVETLKGFVNIYEELSSFPEIFLPISALLQEMLRKVNLPSLLQASVGSVADLIKRKADEHQMSRQPLQMRKQKPEPIKLLNPKFEESFVKGREYDPDREKAERKKLKKLLKKEAKGAIRELRKDNQFILRLKERDRLQQQEEKAKKYGEARAFLQEQEHAFKSGQLGKGRKRRR